MSCPVGGEQATNRNGYAPETSALFFCFFLYVCFVGRASRYIRVMKTNLMHYLSSVYFVNQPLYVSGIFVAHHQEVCCIYTTVVTF